jgi:hypothetical protein
MRFRILADLVEHTGWGRFAPRAPCSPAASGSSPLGRGGLIAGLSLFGFNASRGGEPLLGRPLLD